MVAFLRDLLKRVFKPTDNRQRRKLGGLEQGFAPSTSEHRSVGGNDVELDLSVWPDHVPTGSTWHIAPVAVARITSRLRHAKSRIQEAMRYMLLIESIDPDSDEGRAYFDAAISRYYSCFQTGELAPHLDANLIYRSNDCLLRKHALLKNVRDSFINHPGKQNTEFLDFVILAADGRVIDTPSFLIRKNVYSGPNFSDLLTLLDVTLQWIDWELSKKMGVAHRLAETLEFEDRNGIRTPEDLAKYLLEVV